MSRQGNEIWGLRSWTWRSTQHEIPSAPNHTMRIRWSKVTWIGTPQSHDIAGANHYAYRWWPSQQFRHVVQVSFLQQIHVLAYVCIGYFFHGVAHCKHLPDRHTSGDYEHHHGCGRASGHPRAAFAKSTHRTLGNSQPKYACSNVRHPFVRIKHQHLFAV